MKKAFTSRYFPPLLLVLTSCMYYFCILSSLGGMDFALSSLYTSSDSKEYLEYARFIAGESEYCSSIRTYFYPLLIYLTGSIGGDWLLWFFQFLFWLSGCLMVYFSVLRYSEKKYLAFGAGLTAMLNFSMIVYSVNALTETLVFFLFAFIAYQLNNISTTKGKLVLLVVISILTVTKPSFVFFLIFFLLFIAWELRHDFRVKFITVVYILLSLSPVFIQLGINMKQHQRFFISDISTVNLKEYFYRKVRFYANHSGESNLRKSFDDQDTEIHRNDLQQADSSPTAAVVNYLLDHPGASFHVYTDNLRESLRAGNQLLSKKDSPALYKLSDNLNGNFGEWIHALLLMGWIGWGIRSLKRKRFSRNAYLFWLGLLCYYAIATTGLTFWAGDRLMAPVTALLSVFLPLLLYEYMQKRTQINTD